MHEHFEGGAVSRLTDLIAQAKSKDKQLGADLDREFRILSSRLPFGLNFERHRPEARWPPHFSQRAAWRSIVAGSSSQLAPLFFRQKT
jgi:hypothetical protein